jgi:hypothetical protein
LTISSHPSSDDIWAQTGLVFFATANGGAVFPTGSIAWMSSTLDNNYDNDVTKITSNVISRFLDPNSFPEIDDQTDLDVDRAQRDSEYEFSDQR